MDEGISTYALASYRGFMLSEQIIIPVSLHNPDSLTDAEIVREYLSVINAGYKQSVVKHLGRRGNNRSGASTSSPIAQFKGEFPEDVWTMYVDSSREQAYIQAKDIASRRFNISRAKDEMERILSASEAKAALYDEAKVDTRALRAEQRVVLKALSNPVAVLDSAAYVRMM
jgi:ATP-dependent helicase HepA